MANKTALSANFGRVYNLPSSVIKRILGRVLGRGNDRPIDVLLINKRFYALARPLFLSIIFLRSELTVLQLLRCLACDPPNDWSQVREIELLFSPSRSRVRLTGADIFARVVSFPNLETIRGERNDWMRADSPVYKLLSIQKPRIFEWFTADPNLGDESVEWQTDHFRLQTFSGALRSMFESWGHLTHVHLHDICLLNFPSSSCSVALPADNVHISVCMSLRTTNEASSFFSVPSRLKGSPRCQRLVLELMNDLCSPQVTVDVGCLPSGTVLSLIGFSSDQRRVFGAMFPNGSHSDVVDVPREVVSEDANNDVTGHDQATATVMGPQEFRTRGATQIDTDSSTMHHMAWVVIRVPTQLGHYSTSIVVYGTQIIIRSIDFTMSDLRAYLNSIRGIRDESFHHAPSRIPVGLPHITQFLVSVIFASLLAWRTLLVFVRTALTEIRGLVSDSDLYEDRECSAANSEEDATLRAGIHCPAVSSCLSGPLLIPAHEDCKQGGCASPLS
ncbi:hypothetical protein F5I97DRAFT_224879 [Phlebopus sp. FC_14]|nr:hypothetical protein F5I97DRAFT_224879 [Phlebopus sp. FC_14]